MKRLSAALNVPIQELLPTEGPPEVAFCIDDLQVCLSGTGAQELTKEDLKAIRGFVEFVLHKRRKGMGAFG